MDNNQVAKLIHAATGGIFLGKTHSNNPDWDDTPEEYRNYLKQLADIMGEATYSTLPNRHNSWINYMAANGWTYGSQVDIPNKKHNFLKNYTYLLEHEKLACYFTYMISKQINGV